MVPWAHLREPFSGWMLTDWTPELTHFNPVIRLSKVKQSAFRFCPFCHVPLPRPSFANLWNMHLCSREAALNSQKLPFSQTELPAALHTSCTCGLFGIWWGQTFCASISFELEQLFQSMWLDRLRSRFVKNAWLLRIELGPFCNCCCFS